MSNEELTNIRGRLAPDNTGTVYMLSAGYDGTNKKAYIRLYEPESEEIFLWYDNTGHLPYLISKEPASELENNNRITGHEGFKGFDEVIRYDALEEKDILVTKIKAGDPLSIGGSHNAIRGYLDESWENRIRYYACYVYDQGLVPGMPYRVVDGNLVADEWSLSAEIEKQFNDVLVNTEERFKEPMLDWARLLQAPIPNIRRVAVDIEVRPSVQNRMPSADEAIDPIITVAFAGSDGLRKVIMFDDLNTGEIVTDVPGADEVIQFATERQLIEETLRVIDEYPIVLTFNGDDFDFKFLRNRARNLGVPDVNIPITLGRRFAFLTNGVHVDLYQFFRNRSIQGYAFGNSYREFSLDDIAMGILNQGKIKVDFNNLNMQDMAEYCMQDTYITYLLTSFNDNLVMNLMIMLQRISKMIMEDLSRFGVSRWILALMEWMHRKEGWLIPNTQDIILHKGGTTTTAMIKGKKYQGAIVRDPVPGIHFEVTVVDFASLYPSAIHNWNLSYDTLLCNHEDCKSNIIPGTSHWVCTHRSGMTSDLIGSLKDLRVLWYKPKAKDKSLSKDMQQYYHVTQQALKVFLNASYGVFGAESFPLYCPPLAESTAAVGRFAMDEAGKKATELGVDILYGDTDSVFLAHPTKEQTDALVKWADDFLHIDLEVEKTYRYAIFSKRKKNYLGVYKDGSMDIKGLTGKKRHIPPILKAAFEGLTHILSNVQTMDEFPRAKEDIKGLVTEVHERLKNREFKIEEVAFQMQLGKPLKAYDTNPQHVKAARMLVEMGHEIAQGDIIRYVVTKNDVKPSIIAEPKDVYIKKYEEYLESTFEQLLDALDMSFDALVGRPQQKSLSAFFG
ncbi:DNA-directed DNA polymerase I [Candidatus Bathyarchaeota archaeon]|jgi:DNA polymerase, archaea type|nr:DNA-directed DNA polymerase I [Candidatus Bathyarchaeota archaeon]MBT4319405.1 DNA-directed DNA polymerase I [Candidatus Bathyarchaeota archaeon]MBT4424721.1 DNA-directed DNA polymerase I [Candidatus Bathyarchaeota archaeon]MBT5641875.1 DNA-directed DNA polymerase I [Candidatus Bathyarchaeota archaeon]MBT7187147.1 DNA-directed DNA polymerase I [Candidatus Bathyarchaeota archaeon]